MGLHLHTRQSYSEAEITVQGELTGHAIRQLNTAIEHFRSRGCKIIHLNVKQAPGITDVAQMLAAIGITNEHHEIAIR